MINEPKYRQVILWIVLLISLGILFWLLANVLSSADFHVNDFVEYWAAGYLNLHGQNPYDPELLLDLQKSVGWVDVKPNIMWNPPWVLPFVMLFGSLPYRLGWLLWTTLGFAAIVLGSDYLWQTHGGQPRWAAWLVVFIFYPTITAFALGQITPFIFLGIFGFLFFINRGQETLAGISTIFLTIKPHLMFIFWIVLLIWAIQHKKWKLIFTPVIVVVIATVVAIMPNPEVIEQYMIAITQRPPDYWVTTTFGAILRLIFGWNAFWLQFIPPILGAIWAVIYYYRHQTQWDWTQRLPLLLMVAVLTAAYGWIFDWVVLIGLILQAGSWVLQIPNESQRKNIIIIFLVFNVLALIQDLAGFEPVWHIWMPVLMLGSYLWLRKKHGLRVEGYGLREPNTLNS